MGVKMFAAKDYYLSKRVEDLTADRDSALQNSQDLLHGMQVAYVQLFISRVQGASSRFVYPMKCVLIVIIVEFPRSFVMFCYLYRVHLTISSILR